MKMRLWSIHPKYLDRQGLLAVWREGLLAQKILLQGVYKECPKCCDGKKYEYQNIGLGLKDNNISNKYNCPKCKGTGKIKTPYYNHPQLERFKNVYNPTPGLNPIFYLGLYLVAIYKESVERKYNFDSNKIKYISPSSKLKKYYLTVTTGQLEYEFRHLQRKLFYRDDNKCKENERLIGRHKINIKTGNQYIDFVNFKIEPHPLFKVTEGDIGRWEKIK